MKEQFTPGPWAVRKMKVDYHQHIYALEANLIPGIRSNCPVTRIGVIDLIGSYGHKYIFPNLESSDGVDSSGAFNFSEIDADANAKLIEATPDMHYALKLILKDITGDTLYTISDEAESALMAAINKANPR